MEMRGLEFMFRMRQELNNNHLYSSEAKQLKEKRPEIIDGAAYFLPLLIRMDFPRDTIRLRWAVMKCWSISGLLICKTKSRNIIISYIKCTVTEEEFVSSSSSASCFINGHILWPKRRTRLLVFTLSETTGSIFLISLPSSLCRMSWMAVAICRCGCLFVASNKINDRALVAPPLAAPAALIFLCRFNKLSDMRIYGRPRNAAAWKNLTFFGTIVHGDTVS